LIASSEGIDLHPLQLGAREEPSSRAGEAGRVGATVTIIDGVGIDAPAVAATMEAMRRGDGGIVQAARQSGQGVGRLTFCDVLRRQPWRLGPS
jgi:hypothetical protein